MHGLLSLIALWLSVNFGLPETREHPEIRYLPSRQLAAAHYGKTGVGSDDVVAVYDDDTETIFLRPDWNRRSAADVSVLVHELVHHLQKKARTRYACPQEREALAYEAQELWLQLFGTDLESAFGIDALTLKVKTRCLPP